MKGLLAKLFNGNPFASVTIAGLLTALGGYGIAHFDPSKLTPLGATIYAVIAAGLGVLVHHSNTPTAPK